MAGTRTLTITPGFQCQRHAQTRTLVAEFDQPGFFSNYNGNTRPAYIFRLNVEVLTKIQAESLSGFHHFHQGGKAFWFDGTYGWSHLESYQLVGEGDGSKTQFFLPNRNIDANSISVAIFDGTTTSATAAYSLTPTPGLLTFDTAPDSGDDILASHWHKYKCVFEPDGLKINQIPGGLFTCQLILRELSI